MISSNHMKFLRYNLWKTKRRLSPEAAFRRALWQKLDGAWGNHYVKISWYRAHLVRLASAGTIGVLVAGSFGTGAYAYVSPTVTEDSILYPVKQELEAVEERVFNRTPEAKAQFYLKQIHRREQELKHLQPKSEVINRQQKKIDDTEGKLEDVQIDLVVSTAPSAEHLWQKVSERLDQHETRLETDFEKKADAEEQQQVEQNEDADLQKLNLL